MSQFLNLDSAESAFFARELEYIKSKTYDLIYPAFAIRDHVPVSHEAGTGALSITYYQYTRSGLVKLISNYADDLPRSDVYGQKFTSPVESIAGSYGYNIQEIRSSAMSKHARLPQRKANATRENFEERVDYIGCFGDAQTGLGGFLNNANVPITTLTNGAGGDEEWRLKTPDEIISDLSGAQGATRLATKGREIMDTLLVPDRTYTHLASTPRSSTSDTTIIKYLLNAIPNLKSVVGWWRLATAGASSVGRGVYYSKNPDKVTLEIPQEFEQLRVQEKNLEFVVPVHGRIGGTIFYYPLSARYIDKID